MDIRRADEGEGRAGRRRGSADPETHWAPGQIRSGDILYPAMSRRTGGLSLGINLFPEGKRCSFDCAYCEVLPGKGGPAFSLSALEKDLAAWKALASKEVDGPTPSTTKDQVAGLDLSKIPLDFAFAGDGEPTLSSSLFPAIDAVAAARLKWPTVFGAAKIILITNSTGFLDARIAAGLHDAVRLHGLEIWAKLDAGTESWYRKMDRRGPDFESIVASLLAFSRRSPLVIQSMFCKLRGESMADQEMIDPPEEEIEAWALRLADLARGGARLAGLQVYTQSRHSPHRLTAALDDAGLIAIARRAVDAMDRMKAKIPGPKPIRVFGREGELEFPGGPSW